MKLKKSSAVLLLLFLPVVLLTILRVISMTNSIKSFVDTLLPIIRKPLASEDEKMSMKYPEYYDFIEKIKLITPENSTIYVPVESVYPNPMWYISFQPVDAALLYPRTIYQASELPTKANSPTYVVLFNGYPNYDLKTDRIYLFEKKGIKELIINLYRKEDYNKDISGLIKL